MWYIIWILVSAAIFAKSMESDRWGWLGFPSMLSCVLGGFCAIFALLGII